MAYSKEEKEKIYTHIFNEIIEGRALRTILKTDTGMPPAITFFDWISKDDEKAKQYAHACELRAESIFDEIIEIADDKSRDITITENGEIANNEFIQRSRIRIDARKWIASKLNPKKFGEKIDHTSGGEKIQTVPILTIDPLSDANDNGTS